VTPMNESKSSRCWAAAWIIASMLAGCGGNAGAKLEDSRKAAYAAFNAAVEAFKSGDYAAAEPKLTEALDLHVLNPDVYCEATAKRAVCWGASGKYDEALAELDQLGPAAPNQAEICAARAYIFKKQGKPAQANAAMAQARKFDRNLKEFK
jgi:tetratricopeptide (TPR) repeat protein